MTKQEEFLWIVQTAVLANGIHLAADADGRATYLHVYSSTGARRLMREAVRASALIPDGMDAADAADQFCISMFQNVRDGLSKDDPLTKPAPWFARG